MGACLIGLGPSSVVVECGVLLATSARRGGRTNEWGRRPFFLLKMRLGWARGIGGVIFLLFFFLFFFSF